MEPRRTRPMRRARHSAVMRAAQAAGTVTSAIAAGAASAATSAARAVHVASAAADAVSAAADSVAAAVTGAVVGAAGNVGGVVGSTADAAGGVAGAVAGAVTGQAAGRAATLYRHARNTSTLRRRQLRARNRTPLPQLDLLYPQAHRLAVRSLGVREVPLTAIRGTAVAGPDQRGGDFLPPPPFRSSNWAQRWQRIRLASERLENLPPVDLELFDGAYWVVDGHNRVAAALYAGQVVVDAAVVELVEPGAPHNPDVVSLAAQMADGLAIRAAAGGETASPMLSADLAGSLTLTAPCEPEASVAEAAETRVAETGVAELGAPEAGAAEAGPPERLAEP